MSSIQRIFLSAFKIVKLLPAPFWNPRKSYTGEGSASIKKLEKPVWRPKGRQLNKFRSMLLTTMKTNTVGIQKTTIRKPDTSENRTF